MKVFYIDGMTGKRSNPGTMDEPFQVPRSAFDLDADAWWLRVGSKWFEFAKIGPREYQGTGNTEDDKIKFNAWTGNTSDDDSGSGCGW
jgi:hypothetical protein